MLAVLTQKERRLLERARGGRVPRELTGRRVDSMARRAEKALDDLRLLLSFLDDREFLVARSILEMLREKVDMAVERIRKVVR